MSPSCCRSPWATVCNSSTLLISSSHQQTNYDYSLYTGEPEQATFVAHCTDRQACRTEDEGNAGRRRIYRLSSDISRPPPVGRACQGHTHACSGKMRIHLCIAGRGGILERQISVVSARSCSGIAAGLSLYETNVNCQRRSVLPFSSKAKPSHEKVFRSSGCSMRCLMMWRTISPRHILA